MNGLRRLLLRLALGDSTYQYMVRVLNTDPRTPVAKDVDIVVRKDGVERRIEADWLKRIAKLVRGRQKPIRTTPTLRGRLRMLRWKLVDHLRASGVLKPYEEPPCDGETRGGLLSSQRGREKQGPR